MAEFYPFNEAGCEILYENPHFFVAFGWDKQNECYSVGMRWGGLANHYPLSPSGSGQPQWFILHWDLAVEFLKSLKTQNSANQKAIDEAIDKLQKQQS